MKQIFKKFNKLLVFNWKQIKHNILLWILFGLCAVVQLIIFLSIYLSNNNIVDYSAITILIPNILNCIYMLTGVMILFQNNKNNTIDHKLLCSNYSNLMIKISRFLTILMSLLTIIVIQDIFLIFFLATKLNNYGVIYFVSNTFITPFILVLMLIINILLARKLSQIVYLVVSVILIILTFGLSLITRFITISNTVGNNQNTKLIYSDNEYILNDTSQQINQNYTLINTFIPSEWFLTYYSSLYNSFDFGPTNKPYNLLSYKLTNTVLSNQNKNIGLIIRPNDINFLKLNNYEYEKLILNNIDKIVNKYNLLDNINLINNTNYYVKQLDWTKASVSDPQFAETIKSLLFDCCGVNVEYNQLFYFIKYQSVLLNKVPNIFNILKTNYNASVSDLFKNIYDTYYVNTCFNLFKYNHINNNFYLVNNLYKNNYIVNKYLPITYADKDFLINKLFIFDNNNTPSNSNIPAPNPHYLDTNFNTINEIPYDTLSSLANTSIKNKKDWENYIQNSNYGTINQFLQNLYNTNLSSNTNANIYNYKLSPNSIDFLNLNNIYLLQQANNTKANEILITLIMLLNITLITLFFMDFNKRR